MLNDVEAYLTVAPLLTSLAVIALVLLWFYRGPGRAADPVEAALAAADRELAPAPDSWGPSPGP
jgi:hypothetical protein